jgi:hypothetical protein
MRITPHLLSALLLSVLAVPLWAQGTYTAASCNQGDVNAVINGPTHTAVNGDIINIPAGLCTWTSGITVPGNIGISILGNGAPNNGSGTTGASSPCTNTTITVAGGITVFNMTPGYGNSTSRISCMQITYSSGAAIFASIQGTCTSSGCPNLRMDNLTYANWSGHTEAGISYGINVIGDMFGVLDHNTINGTGGYLQLVEENNAAYLGTQQYGDNSWANSENYGSANFLFFENNTFNDSGCCENEGGTGGLQTRGGGRVVVRYNTFVITDSYNYAMTWHGTESNQRARGGRAFEFYKNTWTCAPGTACQQLADVRSGTGLFWGNSGTVETGGFSNGLFVFNTYRAFGTQASWGPCDGSSVYDTNDATTYYSGTISSVSGNVITVSGSPGWSTNIWALNGAPYSVHDVTQNSGSEITANGSNTLTYANPGGPGQYTPSAGDSIQILRATVCIDQAGGRGAGVLYTGTNGSQQATPQESVASVPSPTYFWENSQSGFSSLGIGSSTARVIRNRDWYSETMNQGAQTSNTSPFDGTINTTGIGHGTLANRPTSCTASSNGGTIGTAYWETDNNQLDFCIGQNTWSTLTSSPASYVPYIYPHPLDAPGGNSSAPPIAPTNLTTAVQ